MDKAGRSRRKLLGLAGGALAIAATAGFVAGRARRDGQGALQRGLEAFREGDYQEAARAFGDAGRADPQLVDAMIWHGIALARLERPAEAIEAFSRALALAPERATVYLYRGEAAAAVGERQEAEDDFVEAARLAAGDERIVAAARFQLDGLRRQWAGPSHKGS